MDACSLRGCDSVCAKIGLKMPVTSKAISSGQILSIVRFSKIMMIKRQKKGKQSDPKEKTDRGQITLFPGVPLCRSVATRLFHYDQTGGKRTGRQANCRDIFQACFGVIACQS